MRKILSCTLIFSLFSWAWAGLNLVSASNQYVNIDALVNHIKTTTYGTVFATVFTTGSAGDEMIVTVSDASQSRRLYFYLDSNERFNARIAPAGTGRWHLRTDSAIPTNQAVHLACVQDGVSPVLYVNGVAVAQTFITATSKDEWCNDFSTYIDNVRIGCINFNNGGNTNFFNGRIQDVLWYWRVFSATEIAELSALRGNPIWHWKYKKNNVMKGWWKLYEGEAGFASTIATDYSSKANHGTIYGSARYVPTPVHCVIMIE